MRSFFTGFLALCFFMFSQVASAQFVQQQIFFGNGGVNQWQGSSVAISKDGRTAVVGAYADSTGRGAIYVFTRSGASWTQQGPMLKPTGYVYTNYGVYFGYSVAISADGNTIIAGGSNDNTDRGAAWVFTRSGNTWTQQGNKLVGSGTTTIFSKMGCSVSLSDDGNTALIGGYLENSMQGAAWVFTRTGNIWTQQGPKLSPPINTWIEFGENVSLSGDGNTALIAGEKYLGRGAAFVFRRNANTWSRDTTLQELSNNYPIQGAFVNISKDGNTAFVSANSPGSPNVGSIAVYVYNGTAWTLQTRFSPPNNIGNTFAGRAMSSSHNGDTLAIGGYQDNSHKGAAWVYARSSTGTWSLIGSKIVPTGSTSTTPKFGTSIALSGNGKLMMVGAPEESNTGKVWFYSASGFQLVSPAVSISSSATTVCAGSSVTFTANPTDGGTAPTYQWKKNGVNVGTNSPTYTTSTLANNDVIQVQMVSNMTGASSTPVSSQNITMSVTPSVIPTVSITSNSGTAFGLGQSVTFTAITTNAGTSPTYRWLKNGTAIPGANTSTYTTNSLMHNDAISMVLLSSATCANPDSLESNKMVMILITGVNKADEPLALSLHPNPVQDQLILTTKALNSPVSVTLTDATGRQYGQQVFVSGTSHKLDVSNLAAGLYLVSVKSKDQVHHLKMIKQ